MSSRARARLRVSKYVRALLWATALWAVGGCSDDLDLSGSGGAGGGENLNGNGGEGNVGHGEGGADAGAELIGDNCVLRWEPTSLGFAPIPPNATRTLVAVLSTDPDRVCDIDGLSLTGSDRGAFRVRLVNQTQQFPVRLGGDSCELPIEVRFAPTEGRNYRADVEVFIGGDQLKPLPLLGWGNEDCNVKDDSQPDADADGLHDLCDPCPEDPENDTDGDGLCGDLDNCPGVANDDQADADDDGLGDACDPCPWSPTNADLDGDGICGALVDCEGQSAEECTFDNCPETPNRDQVDGDGDGIGDACDTCPNSPNNTDFDGDGVCGALVDCEGLAPDECGVQDNCPDEPNPDQFDIDEDGLGDACDPCPYSPVNGDDDGDGFCGAAVDCEGLAPAECATLDNCPDDPNPEQIDSDQDGLGDACDPCPYNPNNIDLDGDGRCGALVDCEGLSVENCRADNCPDMANPDQSDRDGDGLGDPCDPCPDAAANDADGDGFCENVDNCPDVANPDQADVNNDGFGDVCGPEFCDGIDNDGDGQIDEGVANPCGGCGAPPLETCDGQDNDCDGQSDEGCGECITGTTESCSLDVGACQIGERECQVGGIWGGCSGQTPVPETCDGVDNDCDSRTDEQLLNACGECGRVPDEICDTLDNDCDGRTDETCVEICDGADNDADGRIDERVANACGGCGPVPEEICDGSDNDCDGETDEGCGECNLNDERPCGTDVGECTTGISSCLLGGIWGPCTGVAPEDETCDTLDNDCDGTVDETVLNACRQCGDVPEEICNLEDDDCDGTTDETCLCPIGATRPCGSDVGECDAGEETCVGGLRWSECSATFGEPERCDSRDNDCDGRTDEALLNACGTCGAAPPELCNGEDDDCDGLTDENVCSCEFGSERPCSTAVGACTLGTELCTAVGWTECDGIRAVEEICDGIDNDCDGRSDEALLNACNTCGELPAEACNGEDDDCDGTTDEGCDCAVGATRACSVATGLCSVGEQECLAGGQWGDCSGTIAAVEACDGEDNDCDGRTDEGLLNACDACGPVPAEVCNGQDDDCDGSTDEGAECGCPFGATRPCGSAVGNCEMGEQTCPDGTAWTECNAVGPEEETCDNQDNDCDNRTDEDVRNACGTCGEVPEEACNGEDDDCDGSTDETCECEHGSTQACGTDEGACVAGTQLCVEGDWQPCSGTGPVDEVCDGVDQDCDSVTDEGLLNACGQCGQVPVEVCDLADNDCDGQTDEGCACPIGSTRPCGSEIGQCEAGVETCVDGQTWNACNGTGPSQEVCDGQDDDCDGRIDEGTLNVCGTCGQVPAEVCDLEDNDCDGTADEGCLCPIGTNRPCGIATGECTPGVQVCADGLAWSDCNDQGPQAEVCDGLDNDCDARNDEGTLNACGQCGNLPAEVCDGLDNDCDGQTDETCACPINTQEACGIATGECQIGLRTCVDGQSWTDCTDVSPRNEVCDNRDNDCDGRTDEGVLNACGSCGAVPQDICDGLDNDCDGQPDEDCDCVANQDTRPCGQTTGLCTQGIERCLVGGIWGVCSGQGPVAEICDDQDNDCDGSTDEGQSNACGTCGPVPAETCDGVDNDCDGQTDEHVINDCGGCGDVPEETCNGVDDDCDGSTDERLLNACGQCGVVPVETCDNFDNDCDGSTDEGVTNACGTCREVPNEVCDGVDNDCDTRTDEGLLNACGECGPLPAEACDGDDNDCDGRTDEGVTNACGNCGAAPPELCDGRNDEDCDGLIDEGCGCVNGVERPCSLDVGECTVGVEGCVNGVPQECTGKLPVAEVCDNLDNDCDGSTDEGLLNACSTCGPVPNEVCDGNDNDCDGQIDETVANACGQCGPLPAEVCDGNDNDCDGQTDEAVANACGGCGDVPPEICDTVDNDCDGRVDEETTNACGFCGPDPEEVCVGGGVGVDDDCDGQVDEECFICANGETLPCGSDIGECQQGTRPCVNRVEWGDCQGDIEPVAELCDGRDNDCDGSVDEGVQNACGGCGPAPAEICNALDDDCDGWIDEGIPDRDADGWCDSIDNCPDVLQGTQDDQDNDGVGDVCDNCWRTPNADQDDADGDGWGNVCDNCQLVPNTSAEHLDNDGYQLDWDWDGFGDACDVCPATWDPDQGDFDLDGVGDWCDNCWRTANPNQGDADGDGWGDWCDNCWQTPNTSANDLNEDGFQLDWDADGYGDACDNCTFVQNWQQRPDGTYFQPDDDNDGIGTACDNCWQTFNPDQADSDLPTGDGWGDVCDNCKTVPNTTWGVHVNPNTGFQYDADNDGFGDVCDSEDCDGLDNDGDGQIDEGLLNACGQCGAAPLEDCNGGDEDCDGNVDEGCGCVHGTQQACGINTGACNAGTRTCNNGNWGPCQNSTGPIGEVCNNSDDDCDGLTDEGVQNACGGCGALPAEVCNGSDDDCDGVTDEGVLNRCGGCGPLPAEVCNGQDDDCDTRTDEGVQNACGGCGAVSQEICDGFDNDCDGRTDEGVRNRCGGCGAEPVEICDNIDNDCDNQTDEGFPDNDNIGFADCHDFDGDGETEDEGDCHDDNANISSNGNEIWGDGIDSDCKCGDNPSMCDVLPPDGNTGFQWAPTSGCSHDLGIFARTTCVGNCSNSFRAVVEVFNYGLQNSPNNVQVRVYGRSAEGEYTPIPGLNTTIGSVQAGRTKAFEINLGQPLALYQYAALKFTVDDNGTPVGALAECDEHDNDDLQFIDGAYCREGQDPDECGDGCCDPPDPCLVDKPGYAVGQNDQCSFDWALRDFNAQIEARLGYVDSGAGRFPTGSNYSNVMMTPVVGNIDDDNGDGRIDHEDTPDILVNSFAWSAQSNYQGAGYLRALTIENGQLVEKWSVFGPKGASGIAIADANNDGVPEIYTLQYNSGRGRTELVSYNNVGERQWYCSTSISTLGYPSVGDIDNDGDGEIIVGKYICDHNGNRVITTSINHGDQYGSNPYFLDVAVGSPGREVISGKGVSRADGTTIFTGPGGRAATADLDNDNQPELVIANTATGRVYVYDHTVFSRNNLNVDPEDHPDLLWMGRFPSHMLNDDSSNCSFYNGTCRRGGSGPPTIANFDEDPTTREIAIAGKDAYAVFKSRGGSWDDDGVLLWIDNETQDHSSYMTGSSVYDFNGDGMDEVLYADERQLKVYHGAGQHPTTRDTCVIECPPGGCPPGQTDNCDNIAAPVCDSDSDCQSCDAGFCRYSPTNSCNNDSDCHAVCFEGYCPERANLVWHDEDDYQSATLKEYPVIADVDRDGKVEIVIGSSWYGQSGNWTGVAVLGDPDWVAGRPVWNQHAYHVTNITEDLALPRQAESPPHWNPPALPAVAANGANNGFRLGGNPVGGALSAPDLQTAINRECNGGCPTGGKIWFHIENHGLLAVGDQVGWRLEGMNGGWQVLRSGVADFRGAAALQGGVASSAIEISLAGINTNNYSRLRVVVDPNGQLRECTEDNNISNEINLNSCN